MSISYIFKEVNEMEYAEVTKYINKIWDAMDKGNADLETQKALIEIIDGYEQWSHL